jgi:hypothetical protein
VAVIARIYSVEVEMRVNVYAEELTNRIQTVSKTIEGSTFTGLRLYLELPVTVGDKQVQGPFIHHEGDDDSSAVTFWGKQDLRVVLKKALELLEEHYIKATVPNA